MFAPERQRHIAAAVEQHGRVSVQGLAEQHGVTPETIRRDLDQLEAEGLLRRVHGGAVPAGQYSLAERSLSERSSQRGAQKSRIARAALSQLPEIASTSILLDAGTTTEQLAVHLLERLQRENGDASELMVITNAVPIAQRLLGSSRIRLSLLGGHVRGLTGAAVGPEAEQQLRGMRPDVAFIGANGIHPEFGLSTPDPLEAAAKRAMVSAARRVIVVADSSKLGEETLQSFAGLADVDALITDAPPSARLREALASAGVDLIVAGDDSVPGAVPSDRRRSR